MNCVACHQVSTNLAARLFSRQSPRLGKDGVHISAAWMRAFLLNPQALKPGTFMPDVLHALPAQQKAEAAEALAHYLASLEPADFRAPPEFNSAVASRGRALFHEIGCVACHTPQVLPPDSGAASLTDLMDTSLPLDRLASKYSVNSLAGFLRDPLHSRPSGRMPSLRLTESEARSVAIYLLRDQVATNPVVKTPGLAYEAFNGRFDKLPDFDRLNPVSMARAPQFTSNPGTVRGRPPSGLRFHGKLVVPADGDYHFWTVSDDGSQLFIDGRMIVANDGVHAARERSGSTNLSAGDHSIVATYFDNGGNRALRVLWAGPGFEKTEIAAESLFTDDGQPMHLAGDETFTVDPAKAARGKELFAQYNCAACHQLDEPGIIATPLAGLKSLDKGCLAKKVPASAPDFSFTDKQRTELRTALANIERLKQPLSPADEVHRTMTALDCFACHSRGEDGPPTGLRRSYFRTTSNQDLGDEGRIPPPLNGVGAKLRPRWLEKVLFTGASVRPYMATRMPQFGEANVTPLISAFIAADSAGLAKIEIKVDPAARKFGQMMVGTEGASCIACHVFAGHPSLGVPAIDLTTIAERLNSDWFRRYLLHPPSLRPGTRMPSFWPSGVAAIKTVLDGDTEKQISAIWSFLSDGPRAALPPGLIPARMELVADKEPRIYRNFIEGAGPRAIGVGYPEKVNLAFDANQMCVALLWQGAFMDAARHWIARGEGFQPPLGYDVAQFPPGAPFAVLNAADAPWPTTAGKEAGYQFRGYVFDEQRRPSFRYNFEETSIEDLFVPVTIAGSADRGFRRSFKLHAPQPVANLWFRAAVAENIQDLGNGAFVVNENVHLAFRAAQLVASASGEVPAPKPLLRKSGNAFELLVPVVFHGDEAQFVEEISW